MKIFLNKNEIGYLCKLFNIEAKVLFCFENDSKKAGIFDSKIETELIKKNILIKINDGSIKAGKDIENLFKLWLDYKNSIKLITDDSYSLQAVTNSDYVLLFSQKEDDYVFEFEPKSLLVLINAIKSVALLQEINCKDSYIFTIALDDADKCFADIEKNETASIEKVSKLTGVNVDELKSVFKILCDENIETQSVITESKSERLEGLIKIVQVEDCYITFKVIIGEEDRAVIAKGSTNYVLNSMYNF